MKHRIEKNLKILDELVVFCSKQGGKDIDVHLSFKRDVSEFHVCTKIEKMPMPALDALKSDLKAERQHEVEENYWMLGGDSELEGESQMFLVGIMIDEASIHYDGQSLTIQAKRKET